MSSATNPTYPSYLPQFKTASEGIAWTLIFIGAILLLSLFVFEAGYVTVNPGGTVVGISGSSYRQSGGGCLLLAEILYIAIFTIGIYILAKNKEFNKLGQKLFALGDTSVVK